MIQRCIAASQDLVFRSTFSSSIATVHRHEFKPNETVNLAFARNFLVEQKPSRTKEVKTFQKLKDWRKNRDLSFVLSLLFFVDLPTAF